MPIESELANQMRKLNTEFEGYCKQQYRLWSNLSGNRPSAGSWSGSTFFNLASERGKRWEKYVIPLANAWWQERGFVVTWPTNRFESPTINI